MSREALDALVASAEEHGLYETTTPPAHEYLSTSCFHGHHEYCRSMTGYQGNKRPAQCKFCDAKCRCQCHVPDLGDHLWWCEALGQCPGPCNCRW